MRWRMCTSTLTKENLFPSPAPLVAVSPRCFQSWARLTDRRHLRTERTFRRQSWSRRTRPDSQSRSRLYFSELHSELQFDRRSHRVRKRRTALTYRGMGSAERKQHVNAALEKVGMGHRMKHYPSQLSGGQQQRVAVARALAANRPSSSRTSRRVISIRRTATPSWTCWRTCIVKEQRSAWSPTIRDSLVTPIEPFICSTGGLWKKTLSRWWPAVSSQDQQSLI